MSTWDCCQASLLESKWFGGAEKAVKLLASSKQNASENKSNALLIDISMLIETFLVNPTGV